MIVLTIRTGGGGLFPLVLVMSTMLAGYALAGGWFVAVGGRVAYRVAFGHRGSVR